MNLKDRFPIFKNYPELVYLDSAATTQKPDIVLESLIDFYTKYNANVHRGLYPLSEKATELYEATREKVAKFINADPDEIIFTSGTTDSLNGIAQGLYTAKMLPSKPSILVSEAEHHSNLLPWQQLPNVNLSYLERLKNGNLATKTNFDLIALNYISNVTGKINEIDQIRKDYKGAFLVLDLAQAVGHIKVDVKTLGADFVVFSGHKMYGPMGIGVIWGKKEHLAKMHPFKFGGGMIREVSREFSTWAEGPSKFEAGTPSVADAYALGSAINFLNSIGFEEISNHEQQLRKYLLEKLLTINDIKIYHPSLNEFAAGVVSISFKNAHPHDIAQYLGDRNICVRAGHHCTQILHKEVLQIPASLRISLGLYNSSKDIDTLIATLAEAIAIYSK